MADIQSIYLIPGMDCPVEERLVRSALAKVPGISKLEFNLVQRKLFLKHDPDDQEQIEKALASLDMGAVLQKDNVKELPEEQPLRWKKLAIAACFAVASEIAHFFHESAAASGTETTVFGFPLYSCLSLLLALAAICLAGFGTYKKGWIALKTFNLNINALMAVAVTAAVIIGQYPEAATVIVLFDLSETIEAKSLNRARKAIRDLMALAPETVLVQTESGQWIEEPVKDVMPGAIVRVGPGGRIGLDGTVVKGESSVNQAPITGESMPVEKRKGDPVFAGTINEMGSLEYKVTAPSQDTTLARIIHTVEEAQATRAPMQRFVDVFARYYTPCVFLLAIIIAFVPPLLFGADWYASIYKALVILIIGCPCALVISTPVSIVSGMAAATKNGILVKGGIFMEQARKIRYLALDKTGTITEGKPVQTNFENLGSLPDKTAESLGSSLAARSDHPVSRAISEHARGNFIKLDHVEDFTALPGEGISGKIDGQTWYLGNLRLLKRLGKASPELEARIASLEKEGKSVVCLIGEAGCQAIFAAADAIRQTSKQAISELKKLGVTPIMLTGDNEQTAAAIAAQAGIEEFHAQLLPQDKLEIIEKLETRPGKTAMAGDGINDAPALAKADISFAMAGAGADTAIETADVAIMDDDLRKIPRFMRLSASTFSILAQNISIALTIKIIFFVLALTGLATMWMAVFADVGAALLVVGNGLRAMGK